MQPRVVLMISETVVNETSAGKFFLRKKKKHFAQRILKVSKNLRAIKK